MAYAWSMKSAIKPLNKYISIARAAEVAGLSPKTVAGKLRTVKPAHDLLTTRRWLHDYITGRSSRGGLPVPLPEGYVAPEDVCNG